MADESLEISNDMEVIEIDGSEPIDELIEEEEIEEEEYEQIIDNVIETDGATNEELFPDDANGSLPDSDLNDESIDQENDNSIVDADDDCVEDDGVVDDADDGVGEDDDGVIDDDDGILITDDDDDDEEEDIDPDVSIVKRSNKMIVNNNVKDSAEATPIDSENSNSIQQLPLTPVNDSIASQNGKEPDDVKGITDASLTNTDSAKESNSTLKQNDMTPDIDDTETGIPEFLKKCVKIGKCIAINKKTWNDIDIDGNDSILDCPSQVVPLMIKRQDIFPNKLKETENAEKSDSNAPSGASSSSKNMLTISNFNTSSVGKFLVGLGLSRAKQWHHKDAISKVKKQIRREGEHEDLTEELNDQMEYYNECKAANSAYVFPMLKCDHCDFRTEFKLVMEGHLSYPHMTQRREYKCNYCLFATRDCKQIVNHTQVLHMKKCAIEIPPQLYECPVCPYESGVKSKAAAHITKCLKYFNPERLLSLNDELDYPTITPKPITQEDIKIYEATLQALRFAALNPQTKVPHIPGLPSGLQQQMLIVQQQQLGVRGPGRPTKQTITLQPKRSIAPQPNPYGNKSVAPQLYQMLSTATGHTQLIPIQNRSNQGKVAFNSGNILMKNSNNSNKPNILAKTNITMKSPENIPSKSGTFVICEICDGYIKDLEQLRTHMQWIHKVKIHPKMLANRPPLNCQKCQWRFFTDQGLERHLLGAHGLVTSNMQDMVNQNQDGGRCTICGRVFANKLVAHMNQVHKINLKPAHLSYKCTVCSATFNLYRLFENHVYMVHSGSVKRNADGDASGPPKKKQALESNGNEKKAVVNHTVVSGNKVVIASNLPARVS